MGMNKKSFGALLIFCLALLLLAACSKNNTASTSTPAESSSQPAASAAPGTAAPTAASSTVTLPFAEKQTFTVFGKGFYNPIDAPIAYQDMKQKLNVDIKWDVYPSGYDEKKNIVLSTKSLKDLNQVYIQDGFNYGPKGAFLDLSKYLDKMPNLVKAIEQNADSKYAFEDENGSFYVAPQFKYNYNDQDLGLAINSDKFAEWGIPVPKTLDDVYQAAKTIKAKNPQYFPIVGWTDPNQLFSVLRALMNYAGIGDEPDVRYFPADNTYKYSLLQPQFKDVVAWLAKAYSEGLINKEYPTTTSVQTRPLWSEWEVPKDNMYDHFTSFIGSFTPNNTDQFQRFHEQTLAAGEVHNPQFEHLWLSDNMSFKVTSVNPLGGLAINADVAKDSAKLANVLAFVDWMYSDEAELMFNYGREGWHYDMVDGKPKVKPLFVFGTKEYTDFRNGPVFASFKAVKNDASKIPLSDQIYNWGFYQAPASLPLILRDNADAQHQMYPSSRHDEIYSQLDAHLKTAASTGVKPLPFTADELNQIAAVSQKARDFALTQVDQFILGKRPMTEFDQFIADLKAAGASQLETIYNTKNTYMK